MTIAYDMVGREINVGDFVCYFNHLYEVKEISQMHYLSMRLYPGTRNSKQKNGVKGKECCVIPRDDILIWIMKKDHA